MQPETCGRSVITLNGQRRRTVFVEDNLQFLIFAAQEVNALIAGVFRDTVNLFQNFVELFHVVFNRCSVRSIIRGVGNRLCLRGKFGNRLNTFVGCLNRLNRLAHAVQQRAQVAGAVGQRLRGVIR